MPKVLITTEAQYQKPGPHVELLTQHGYEVVYPSKSALLNEAEVLAAVPGAVAVLAGSEPYTERVLSALPELRVIARHGVGYDRIDVPAATRRGIAVAITPDANHEAVAEHTFALMLAVARSIVSNANSTREGRWKRQNVSLPLRGRTLGIIGLGRIGRSVAVRAKAFGMRVVACENCPREDFVAAQGIQLLELEKLLRESDFVSLHAPMTSETRRLINRERLALMKPGSVLINAARGGLVDEADLLEALTSGHLAGAGLDVLATEPPPADHPLLSLPSVVVTPHVASFDMQGLQDMALSAVTSIVTLLAGQWPAEGTVVNPEVRAAWEK